MKPEDLLIGAALSAWKLGGADAVYDLLLDLETNVKRDKLFDRAQRVLSDDRYIPLQSLAAEYKFQHSVTDRIIRFSYRELASQYETAVYIKQVYNDRLVMKDR